MAATKTRTSIAAAVTMTAAAADVTSSAVTLTTGYGASLDLKLTNGGTGPTVAAQIQIQLSNDNTTYWNFGGPLIGKTSNSGVSSWAGIRIPIGAQYLKIVTGSNTGQNVTLDADISEVSTI